MANRLKEDEKNEKIIRGLLKLPANRRCINCNSLGPQYVCTNFWTFVCTNCSGIHREFTHRVKSVSMAKFTSQEVNALQGGGNERAKEIYLKEWDSQRQSLPDSSNVERLRDFIRHVYVTRNYTGERSVDKPPRAKPGDKDDSSENRTVDPYRSGSRSPPYEETYDRYGGRSSSGARNDDKNYRYNDDRRSPGYGDNRSPGPPEVVNNWRREDRFGNGRRSEDRRSSDGESKSGGRSPNYQDDLGTSPPTVRPVRDILGDDVPPLRIGEPPKANAGKVVDGSVHTQRTASSSSLGSIDGNQTETKSVSLGSLIDFNADPEPPTGAAAVPSVQPTITTTVLPVTHLTSSLPTDGDNWASFDFATQSQPQVQAQAAPTVNMLDSVLSQLSGPSAVPMGNMLLPSSGGAPTTAPSSNMYNMQPAISSSGNISTLPTSSGLSPVAPGGMFQTLPVNANDGGQWPNLHQNFQSVGGVPNNQSWSSLAPRPLTAAGQPTSAPTQQASAGVASQATSTEAKHSGREALPEDLFTATYPAVPVHNPRWDAGASHGMGFGMQYPTAAPMPTYPQSSRPTNPFDINSESTMVHAASFPSMASLQGALPNAEAPLGLSRASSVGAPSPGWMSHQPPTYAAPTMQSQPYAALPQSGAFMGQQIPPSNMPAMGHQGLQNFGGDAAFFGTSSTGQQLDNRFSQPSNQTSFPSQGGNPFG